MSIYKPFVLTTIIAVAIAASATAAPPRPKISMKAAEASALHKFPGKVVSAKYEHEDGRWQYAVVVKTKKGMYEVEVSSTTGTVLDSERTSPGEERREEAADRAAATRHSGE